MNLAQASLDLHRKSKGKIEIRPKVPLETTLDLSLAYTPGVAEVCKAIANRKRDVYTYTTKANTVAVVSDGSAVLGLGDIGPEAALPVMEGKALLFKVFGNVDAVPICLAARDEEAIIFTVKALEPTFGGINLEDISAPRCFSIEQRLQRELDIPVFHDDQHGTAVVVLAALINALKIVGKEINNIRVVINGAGAAGIATAKLLLHCGVAELILCDKQGAIFAGRAEGMNPAKEEIASLTNKEGLRGPIGECLKGADVFIGVSAPGVITEEMVSLMNKEAVVMAMANPVPEIMPEVARRAGARVVCTGRSDFSNQVNNVLAFPGIFRGALDVQAREINIQMKLAAAYALAELVGDDLREDYVIPCPFDQRVVPAIASAVRKAALETGVARYKPEEA